MQIFDDSATIRVVYGPVTANIPKEDFSVFINDDDVILKQDGIVVFGPIRFSIITVPTVTSAEDARSQIAAFLNTASSAVSVTSVIPGTGATNLGKAIDDAVGATDTGVAALVQRDDVLTTLTPADGDWTTIRVDSTGSQWVRLTDLLSASAETADEAKDPLLTNSVMYGFDTEASSGSQLRAVQVAVDNAALSATPNVLVTGGIHKSSADAYGDNDAVPMHYDSAGNLLVAMSSDIQIGAVELKDGTTDARQTVRVDNATATATPTVAMVGAIFKSTSDTYGDNDASPLHVNVSGSLKTVLDDGTNEVVIQAAAAETEDEDSNALQTVSAMYGFDSEGSANSRLRSIQVAVDNAGLSATPNVLVVGGIHKSANDTYADNDAVPDHYDAQGAKHVTAQIPTAEYKSPDDFTAVNTSSTTITLSGLPFTITDDSQIAYIRFVPTGGSGARVLVNGLNGITITEASGVLTVNGAGTPFAGSDLYEVGINGPSKAYDLSLDSQKTIEQAPVWTRYTDKEDLIASAQAIENIANNLGAEIDMRGYNKLGLWLTLDINSSTDVKIRILHKHTSGGAEEFREIYLGSPAANTTTINLNDYEFAADTDQLVKFVIDVDLTTPFVQIQVFDAADGTGQIDAAAITKGYAG